MNAATVKRFEAKIDLGNEAMQTPENVADALENLAFALRRERLNSGIVRDANGQTVGSFALVEVEEGSDSQPTLNPKIESVALRGGEVAWRLWEDADVVGYFWLTDDGEALVFAESPAASPPERRLVEAREWDDHHDDLVTYEEIWTAVTRSREEASWHD